MKYKALLIIFKGFSFSQIKSTFLEGERPPLISLLILTAVTVGPIDQKGNIASRLNLYAKNIKSFVGAGLNVLNHISKSSVGSVEVIFAFFLSLASRRNIKRPKISSEHVIASLNILKIAIWQTLC